MVLIDGCDRVMMSRLVSHSQTLYYVYSGLEMASKKPFKNLKSPNFRFLGFLFYGAVLYKSCLISYFNHDL